MSDVNEFYDGKKVAVVGGAGMVGHKLVRLLIDAGADVLVVDNFSRGRTIIDSANYLVVNPRGYFAHKIVSGSDIRMRGSMLIALGVDASDHTWMRIPFAKHFAVFNLAAAVAGVLHNENNHLQMYQDNIGLLAGPLRAAELARVPNFLQTSSVCVYAEHYQSPSKEHFGFEDEPHAANAGYAESKRDGERMVHWSNIGHTVIVRPSNIIGEGDYFDKLAHVIPAFIKRAVHVEDGGVFTAYGNPLVQREFIYSGDVARGMMTALALGENREAYNIGTSLGTERRNNIVTMNTLAHKIIDLVNYRLGITRDVRVVFDNSRGGGDSLRFSDSGKLEDLGWTYEVALEDAISKTIDYYIDEVLPCSEEFPELFA